MCGIYGATSPHDSASLVALAGKMGAPIRHRGPDDEAFVINDRTMVGNMRLAIIDVDSGQQPITSRDGAISLVQNGEIFNYLELQQMLRAQGVEFDTNSDTEVLLRMYEHFGVDFVKHLNGMFAIAISDARTQTLRLYRDRLGVKPLYWTKTDAGFLFGSEIKSLLAAGLPRKVNFEAMHHFLSFNYVPHPLTMFDGIQSLEAGSRMDVTIDGLITTTQFWNLPTDNVGKDRSELEIQNDILTLLEDATSIRLRSDVEVGAFLSGGLDSSSVVGVASQFTQDRLATFAIGFPDSRFDESEFAQEVADKFNTQHTMTPFLPADINHWLKAVYHCDQPHGDVSFLPTYVLAKSARDTGIKVVLSGDGADELFAGYEKYPAYFSDLEKGKFDPANYFSSISLLDESTKHLLYTDAMRTSLDGCNSFEFASPIFDEAEELDPINQALYFDTKFLLQGNNLVKPDRMGMAASVEVRSPYLDYRMAELAFTIPGKTKLKAQRTKSILKDALVPMLGERLVNRQKQMFTVPVGDWLKGDLFYFARDLLCGNRATERNLFRADQVALMLGQHVDGKANHTRLLRALIAIELWFRMFIDDERIPSSLHPDDFFPQKAN